MSETSAVRPHLERRFETHRVVFWHDPEGEYAAELDTVGLQGVETVRVVNNEYASKNRLLQIARALLIENASGGDAKYVSLADYGLNEFFWQGAGSIYGYMSPSPSIDDFVLWVFRQATAGFKSERPGGLRNIQLDFASLRNDRHSQQALATLAKRVARDLDYASTIEDARFRELLGNDLFE